MRFSIRDLLWLTALAAILSAWAVDHWRQEARIQQVIERSIHPWSGFTLDAF